MCIYGTIKMSEANKIINWAITYCKKFNTYIDVGAHNGDTSTPFISKFARVYAFEPNPTTNTLIPATVRMFPYALGDKNMEVVLTIPNNGLNDPRLGSTTRYELGAKHFSVTQKTLDSFEFKHVDLIKINVEGGELGVVNGAINTIHKWKPVVLFEQNEKVVDFFAKLGYNIKEHKSDTIAYYE